MLLILAKYEIWQDVMAYHLLKTLLIAMDLLLRVGIWELLEMRVSLVRHARTSSYYEEFKTELLCLTDSAK